MRAGLNSPSTKQLFCAPVLPVKRQQHQNSKPRKTFNSCNSPMAPLGVPVSQLLQGGCSLPVQPVRSISFGLPLSRWQSVTHDQVNMAPCARLTRHHERSFSLSATLRRSQGELPRQTSHPVSSPDHGVPLISRCSDSDPSLTPAATSSRGFNPALPHI